MGDYILYNAELYHYGVKGMKWGVRRYQNKDGSLTEMGKKRVRNDSDMLFYDYRRKERKLRSPITNRNALKNDARLGQAKELYINTVKEERDRLLKERTTLKKYGYKFVKDADSDIEEHNNDILTLAMRESHVVKTAQKKFTETELDAFGDALIADLGLKNTEKTKTFVTETLITNNRLVQTNLGINAESTSDQNSG